MTRKDSVLSDANLAELIRLRNFKQALKNVEKKLKKQPKDQELLSLKADLSFKSGDIETSRMTCQELVAQVPPISDLDIVNRVYQVSSELSESGATLSSAQLDNLWQNAIKSQTTPAKKLKLGESWVDSAIAKGQWGQMIKAAGVLSRLNSDDHSKGQKYFWWQIVGQWMLSSSTDVVDERIRGLSKELAKRMLLKALESTSKGHTREDRQGIFQHGQFDLFALIFMKNGDQDLLLKEIEDKSLGGHSPKAIDEWDVNKVKFDIYDNQGNHEASLKLAKEILEDARFTSIKWRRDHWGCYQRLLNNATGERLQETQGFLENYTAQDQLRHAPELAILYLKNLALEKNLASGPKNIVSNTQTDVILQSKRLYDAFGHQVGCVADLQDTVRGLTPSQREDLRDSLHKENESLGNDRNISEKAQLKWIAREINVLSIDFTIHSFSAPFEDAYERSKQSDFLRVLIKQCLMLYKASRQHTAQLAATDTGPGDSACMLAARALIRLGSIATDESCIIQAACLLALLIDSSRHNFGARLMFINVASHLGLPTLALKHYSELGVKEILSESCCPMAFCRVSSTLPFAGKSMERQEMMKKSLLFYGNALQQVPHHQKTALDNENYVPCIELEHFSDRIQNSMTRRMLIFERRRIARLCGQSADENGLKFDSHPPTKVKYDPKASEEVPWMKTMQDKILLLEPPPMSELYVNYSETIDWLLDFKNQMLPPNECATSWIENVATRIETFQNGQLTSQEYRSLKLLRIILRIRDIAALSNKVDVEFLIREIKDLRLQLIDMRDALLNEMHRTTPHWKILHYLTCSYEMLSATSKLAIHLTTRTESLKHSELNRELEETRRFCCAESLCYKAKGEEVLARLKSLTTNDGLFRLVFGSDGDEESQHEQVREAVSGAFSETDTKRIVGEFAKAGVEALDLLLKGLKPL